MKPFDYEDHAGLAAELASRMWTCMVNAGKVDLAAGDAVGAAIVAIMRHMGPWSHPRCLAPIDEYGTIDLLCYQSDYLASRPDLGTPVDGDPAARAVRKTKWRR